ETDDETVHFRMCLDQEAVAPPQNADKAGATNDEGDQDARKNPMQTAEFGQILGDLLACVGIRRRGQLGQTWIQPPQPMDQSTNVTRSIKMIDQRLQPRDRLFEIVVNRLEFR